MPFPRTWTEELVCEYLELEGYSVRTNLPFPAAEKGGKKGELDILAFRMKNNRPEIIHMEVGIPERLRDVERKVERSRRESKRILEEFGLSGRPKLRHWFVNAGRGWGGKQWEGVKLKPRERGVRCITLRELLGEILSEIQNWKEGHRWKYQKQNLPGNLWLLKLLEALEQMDMITISK
jgi:hypothetical protein